MNIVLICGTPGSGKTWICNQLKDKYFYIPHDDYIGKDYGWALIKKSRSIDKPILGEAPFQISELIRRLQNSGATVKPYFIIEDSETTKTRYEDREKKPIPQGHLTRIETLKKRAKEYRAPYGTSSEILEMLK